MKTAVHVPAKYRLPTSSNPHCTPTVVSTHAVPQNLHTGGRPLYQSPGDAMVAWRLLCRRTGRRGRCGRRWSLALALWRGGDAEGRCYFSVRWLNQSEAEKPRGTWGRFAFGA